MQESGGGFAESELYAEHKKICKQRSQSMSVRRAEGEKCNNCVVAGPQPEKDDRLCVLLSLMI